MTEEEFIAILNRAINRINGDADAFFLIQGVVTVAEEYTATTYGEGTSEEEEFLNKLTLPE